MFNKKNRVVLFVVIFVVTLIFSGCHAAQKEKDYIISVNNAAEKIVPDYLAVISNQPPKTESLLFLKTLAMTEEQKNTIKALFLFLNTFPRYDSRELSAISDSWNQFLATSRVASDEAKK